MKFRIFGYWTASLLLAVGAAHAADVPSGAPTQALDGRILDVARASIRPCSHLQPDC